MLGLNLITTTKKLRMKQVVLVLLLSFVLFLTVSAHTYQLSTGWQFFWIDGELDHQRNCSSWFSIQSSTILNTFNKIERDTSVDAHSKLPVLDFVEKHSAAATNIESTWIELVIDRQAAVHFMSKSIDVLGLVIDRNDGNDEVYLELANDAIHSAKKFLEQCLDHAEPVHNQLEVLRTKMLDACGYLLKKCRKQQRTKYHLQWFSSNKQGKVGGTQLLLSLVSKVRSLLLFILGRL